MSLKNESKSLNTKRQFLNALQIYKRQIQASKGSYHQIMKMLTLFMSAVWATYQTSDMGQNINNMLILCAYNGAYCRPHNFSIVESHDHWNCFTFRPNQRYIFDPQVSTC